MRYFVIADVHGYYDLMIKALDKAGFDKHDPDHCLISLGDAIDRGPQSLKVIQYLNSLPNKILIRGNHEDLVDELLTGRRLDGYDKTNGSYYTVIQMAEAEKGYRITDTLAEVAWDTEVIQYAQLNESWKEYYNSTINYVEIGKFIFVHGWIPTKWQVTSKFNKTKIPEYKKKWRKNSTEYDWKDARWLGGIFGLTYGVVEPDKIIVCGHWTASDFHIYVGKQESPVNNYNTFISKDCIACDACTAYSKSMNVVVIENNDLVKSINVR